MVNQRWVETQEHAVPTGKLVKAADLPRLWPANARRITPQQRQEQTAAPQHRRGSPLAVVAAFLIPRCWLFGIPRNQQPVLKARKDLPRSSGRVFSLP
jgi:hypothetical protein